MREWLLEDVLKQKKCEVFKIMVVGGFTLTCTKKIYNLSIEFGEYELRDDLFVVSIGDMVCWR